MSSIICTDAEDLEVESDKDHFTLDDPTQQTVIIPAKGNKILKKPDKLKEVVGQFQPSQTLKSTIRGHTLPKLACTQTTTVTKTPIHYILDKTQPEGVESKKIWYEPANI